MNEGDPAPDVILPLADGARSLTSFLGAPVVIYFYPKDDTPGCTTEAQAFNALLPNFAAIATPVIGVSRDDAEAHARFSAKRGLTLPLAADVGGEVCAAFKVWVEKSMYGKSYMGIERATFLIAADGRISQIWHKVKVAGHADIVLAAAQALVS